MMPHGTTATIASTKEINEFIRKVHGYPYYHGLRSRAHVEENLKEKGDFLFRMVKARKNEIVLSICLGANNDPKYGHYPIAFNPIIKQWEFQVIYGKKINGKATTRSEMEKSGDGGSGAVNKKGLQFSSLKELIKYYREHQLFGGLRLKAAIRRPRWLIPISSLRCSSKDLLGKGHYCQVFKGRLRGKPDRIVAIKMLLDGENDPQQNDVEKDEGRDAMFREAAIMAKCRHKYVVTYFGVQCDIPPVMIIMECCPGGSLDIHLQREKEKIADGERAIYCYEAARGMKYLHFHKIVHRDLAARNCLIASNGVIKISDFGLSRSLDPIEVMDIANIPLRWMAPETIRRPPLFSTKSDIWSYGVLLFEIFNLGIKPWIDEDDQKKIAHMIRHGPMPDLPERTPPQFKDLIHQCWNITSSERPEFPVIVNYLIKMVRDNPNILVPKANEFTVNRLPDVEREEIRTMSSDEVEKDVVVLGLDNQPSITTEEGVSRVQKFCRRIHNATRKSAKSNKKE